MSHRVDFPVHYIEVNKKFPVRVRLSVLSFLPWHFYLIHEVKTTKRSKSTGNKFAKQQRWRPESRRNFFGFPRRFLEGFFALSTPHEFGSTSKGNKKKKKTVFIAFLASKDFGGFKDRQEMSRFQVLPWSQFLQTLVLLIFPWKSTHAKFHAKMAKCVLVGF